MRGGGETGVEEDGVGALRVEGSPRLVCDVELGEDAAPVEEEGLLA